MIGTPNDWLAEDISNALERAATRQAEPAVVNLQNRMQQEAEILLTANKAVAAAYLEKTGKSMEELLGIMDAETWMDAQKAVEYGFVDEVMFASAPTLTNGIGVLPAQTIHNLKDHLPARGEENAEVKTVTAKLKLLRLKGEMKDEV